MTRAEISPASGHEADEEPILISVVIPHYNDAERLAKLLARLNEQRFSSGTFEVIVVDNGSTKPVVLPPVRFPLRLITEGRRGSYAARNAGIRAARGDIIALIDSDCLPVEGWLQEGYEALETLQADLVGGHVRFFFSGDVPTGAEFVDSMTNMQMELIIRQEGVANTANLFFHRSVIDSIGEFPSTLQSGGDTVWTERATKRGFKLDYAPRAEVVHPARRMPDLLRKQYRVGQGHGAIARMNGQPRWRILLHGIAQLRPPSRSVPIMLRRAGGSQRRPNALRVWGTLWASVATTAVGRMRGAFRDPLSG